MTSRRSVQSGARGGDSAPRHLPLQLTRLCPQHPHASRLPAAAVLLNRLHHHQTAIVKNYWTPELS